MGVNKLTEIWKDSIEKACSLFVLQEVFYMFAVDMMWCTWKGTEYLTTEHIYNLSNRFKKNGEARAGFSQPAWQHCLHSAETSGMATHTLCWHRHPRLCHHWPGLHWHRRRPLCDFTEHPSVGGTIVTSDHTKGEMFKREEEGDGRRLLGRGE